MRNKARSRFPLFGLVVLLGLAGCVHVPVEPRPTPPPAPPPPVVQALHADPQQLRHRTEALAAALDVPVVGHQGRVGGGGAPGVPLPGWGLRLPAEVAPRLRTGEPAVLPLVHDGACLVDLRCVPEVDDARLLGALRRAL